MKEKDDDNMSLKESSEVIVNNIIMISPAPKIYKKLVKMSNDRDKNLSTLVEEIVEEYVSKKGDNKGDNKGDKKGDKNKGGEK